MLYDPITYTTGFHTEREGPLGFPPHQEIHDIIIVSTDIQHNNKVQLNQYIDLIVIVVSVASSPG